MKTFGLLNIGENIDKTWNDCVGMIKFKKKV